MYVFKAVVRTARCAVRAPFEGRNVCVTCTCGAMGSARSDAGGDIAAQCPYPAEQYAVFHRQEHRQTRRTAQAGRLRYGS